MMKVSKGNLYFDVDPYLLLAVAQNMIKEGKHRECDSSEHEKRLLEVKRHHFEVVCSPASMGEVQVIFRWFPEFDVNGKIIVRDYSAKSCTVSECCETYTELEKVKSSLKHQEHVNSELRKEIKEVKDAPR